MHCSGGKYLDGECGGSSLRGKIRNLDGENIRADVPGSGFPGKGAVGGDGEPVGTFKLRESQAAANGRACIGTEFPGVGLSLDSMNPANRINHEVRANTSDSNGESNGALRN